MNNIINFYYGIYVIDLYELEDKYVFKYNDKNYYFMEYDRNPEDIKSLIEICIELKKRNILTNEFVYNKFNEYLVPYNNKFYILIKENISEYKINYNDILYIQNSTMGILSNKNITRTNYVDLWKKKIDYYESKIHSYKYQLINKTIDYYIGLGENAISYIVNNDIKINNIVLSHRRINEKMSSFDFYNPINYILDNRGRDLADYIKELFFYNETSEEVLISFLYYMNLSREEYILFLSRMLYPTHYFDLIDRILIHNEDEDILKNIINRTNDYIKLLKKIIYYINYTLRMNIPVIEWIIKM